MRNIFPPTDYQNKNMMNFIFQSDTSMTSPTDRFSYKSLLFYFVLTTNNVPYVLVVFTLVSGG